MIRWPPGRRSCFAKSGRLTGLTKCSITSTAIARSKVSVPRADGSSSTPNLWNTNSGALFRATRRSSAFGSQPITSYPWLASSQHSAPFPHPISTMRRARNSAHSLMICRHRYAFVCWAAVDASSFPAEKPSDARSVCTDEAKLSQRPACNQEKASARPQASSLCFFSRTRSYLTFFQDSEPFVPGEQSTIGKAGFAVQNSAPKQVHINESNCWSAG